MKRRWKKPRICPKCKHSHAQPENAKTNGKSFYCTWCSTELPCCGRQHWSCDGCGRLVHAIVAQSYDSNGDPDVGLCFFCTRPSKKDWGCGNFNAGVWP